MMNFGFIVNVHNKIFSIGYEDIFLSRYNLRIDFIKRIMVDDTRIRLNRESIPQKLLDWVGSCISSGSISEQQQEAVMRSV